MIIRYRFLEATDRDRNFVVGMAYTGYFDDSDKPGYISKRVTKERELKNKLEDLKPEDAPGVPIPGFSYKWSEIFEVDSPDNPDDPNMWDSDDAMDERDRILNLRKTA